MSIDRSWTVKSQLISDFCVAAKNGETRQKLANLFVQAVDQYRNNVADINAETAIVNIANEIKIRMDSTSQNDLHNLHDVFNWLHDNRNIPSIPLERVNVVSAADGVRAGLETLDIHDPILKAA